LSVTRHLSTRYQAINPYTHFSRLTTPIISGTFIHETYITFRHVDRMRCDQDSALS